MVSNGRALVIKNNRYNKTYIYPLKTTPLEYILDKEFILNNIKNLEPQHGLILGKKVFLRKLLRKE